MIRFKKEQNPIKKNKFRNCLFDVCDGDFFKLASNSVIQKFFGNSFAKYSFIKSTQFSLVIRGVVLILKNLGI